MIEIRDTSGDHRRQQEIASKIFTALESAGWWRAVYIDDMQKVPDSYDPALERSPEWKCWRRFLRLEVVWLRSRLRFLMPWRRLVGS